ncbi:hypothetical protein [Methylogaea oryzae]|uniref:Uncharacterized protein n=1 Tax=Methylogaea oryzae TaxID=1295382 RepID=A0A8D5AKX2_9GAMM|nr:hypothetical protein [Methylogaea oryzae]BBL71566.1 hypothetical protein MoryE10_21720 [Methylogaea oryzae]
MQMLNAEELKKIYATLDREDKPVFLDGLLEILQQHESAKGRKYDAAQSPQERIALLSDAAELRQLIHSIKSHQKTIRKNPENDAHELWQSLEKFFEDA